jgi:hypothetical protein
MNRIAAFIRDALAGYEPTLVRAFAVAVFVLLASFGIGTGDLPPQVEAVLTFLTFAVPIIGGYLTRRKVIPVASVALPANPYPDGGPHLSEDELG